MASSVFLWPGPITFSGAVTATDLTVTGTVTTPSVTFTGGSLLDGAVSNTLAQRNGVNAQQLNIYRTYANSGTDYERIEFAPGSTNEIRSANGGTGSYRAFMLTGLTVAISTGSSGGAATARWRVDSTGNLIAVADASYDIGATNATRPRHTHLSGYVAIGDGITAPGAGTGEARIYVDTADGDLKIVFADGVVKTIVVDT